MQQSRVVIKTDTIRDALTEVSKELTQNPLNCGFLAVNCIGGDFNVGTRIYQMQDQHY